MPTVTPYTASLPSRPIPHAYRHALDRTPNAIGSHTV